MSDDERQEFLRTVCLAQAALRAASEREERQRNPKTDGDESSVHHMRFQDDG